MLKGALITTILVAVLSISLNEVYTSARLTRLERAVYAQLEDMDGLDLDHHSSDFQFLSNGMALLDGMERHGWKSFADAVIACADEYSTNVHLDSESCTRSHIECQAGPLLS